MTKRMTKAQRAQVVELLRCAADCGLLAAADVYPCRDLPAHWAAWEAKRSVQQGRVLNVDSDKYRYLLLARRGRELAVSVKYEAPDEPCGGQAMTDITAALELARKLPVLDINAYVDPDALLLARAILALAAERDAMRAVVEAAEKLSPRIEPFGGGDWACAECRPESDILVAGFQCHVHALRAALDSYRAKVQR